MVVRTVSYGGGNRLAYVDVGDPRGYPILVQHGMIASIRDTHLFDHLIEVGARVISIARPGYGESRPHEMKDLAEWGDIVAVLVGELDLSQFDVLGISSGAPYSYAIGYEMPGKVRNIFVLSGTPALYDESIQVLWPYPIDKTAAIPELQALARGLFFSDLSDEALLADDIRDSMMNDCFGIGQDLHLRVLDWGFRLADVRAHVVMQHSRADHQVPFTAAELTSRMLPDCQFVARENDEHFSGEVLDGFVSREMAGFYRR